MSQHFAFVPTHGGQLRNRGTETGDDRRLGGGSICFALVLVDDLDHAFERQDSVEPRRGGVHAPGQTFDGCQYGREHGLVDAHDRRHAHPFDRERAIHRAARQYLGCAVTRRSLDHVPPRR